MQCDKCKNADYQPGCACGYVSPFDEGGVPCPYVECGRNMVIDDNLRSRITVALGPKIREKRILNNMTQEELAKIIGVSRVSIVGFERCRQLPTVDHLFKLCLYLDISLDEILMEVSSHDPDCGDEA